MSLFERVNLSQHSNTRQIFDAHISPKVSSYGKDHLNCETRQTIVGDANIINLTI